MEERKEASRTRLLQRLYLWNLKSGIAHSKMCSFRVKRHKKHKSVCATKLGKQDTKIHYANAYPV